MGVIINRQEQERGKERESKLTQQCDDETREGRRGASGAIEFFRTITEAVCLFAINRQTDGHRGEREDGKQKANRRKGGMALLVDEVKDQSQRPE
jgi:hypothetical protein